MGKFRVSQYDAPVRPKPKDVAPSYVPILDQHGSQVGHVHGLKSSEATISRFGVRDAKLTKRNGVHAWRGTTAPRQVDGRHAQNVRTAKGSTTKHPTKPETSARPKR
jgi:hypothetical protein